VIFEIYFALRVQCVVLRRFLLILLEVILPLIALIVPLQEDFLRFLSDLVQKDEN